MPVMDRSSPILERLMHLHPTEIDLSLDGATWTKVAAGTLSIAGMEQPVVLDAPVNARFARLRVLSARLSFLEQHGGGTAA